jgi:hypothetical protein
MHQNRFDENSLVTVPHPRYSPDLAHPTSGFLVTSRYLLQVVYSMILTNFVRKSSSLGMKFSPLNHSLFSPLDRMSEMEITITSKTTHPEFVLSGPFWRATTTTYESPVSSNLDRAATFSYQQRFPNACFTPETS